MWYFWLQLRCYNTVAALRKEERNFFQDLSNTFIDLEKKSVIFFQDLSNMFIDLESNIEYSQSIAFII